MRMGSTFAAIEPFGLSFPECGPSISAMPLGTCGQGAAARLALFSRYAALRKSRAASVSCALHSMAKDAKPIFTAELWSLAGTQINVLTAYVAGFRQVSWA